jgi:hypothetical protein
MPDNLSAAHYRAVRSEIEGRFFSAEEAAMLKESIDMRTVTHPKMRRLAAKSWGGESSNED